MRWSIHRHPGYLTDGMHALYLNGMLRSLVFALVGIFTPVYVYQRVLMTWNSQVYAIMAVGSFYLVTRLVVLVAAIPVSRIIEKIGFRRSITISVALLAGYLSMLLLGNAQIGYLLIAPLCGGLYLPFYWIARSSVIAQDGEKRHVGVQLSRLGTIELTATLLGPLAAGLIIEKWGFEPLFGVALLILALSVIPLWWMSPHVHQNGASWRGFGRWIRDRRYFHIAVGVGGRAIDDYVMSILWPLMIFGMGIKTTVIGGIFSLVSLISLAVRMVSGQIFDKLHKRRDYRDEIVYAIAIVATSMVWVLRLFAKSVGAILWLDTGGSLFGTTYASLYGDYEVLGGMRMGAIAYWVYCEMVYSLMVVGLMVLVILGATIGIWRELVLITAAFWVLVSLVMARESNMKS